MVQRRPIPKVFVRYSGGLKNRFEQYGRHCIGRSFPSGYMARKKSNQEILRTCLWIEKVFKDQWINVLISLKQRTNAKDCMKNTQGEMVNETDRSILRSKSDSDVTNNPRVPMSTITQLILEQDGNVTLQPDQQLRLHQGTGSSTTIGIRIKVGILGEPLPWLNSKLFFFSGSHFACRKFMFLASNGECGQIHLPHAPFLMHSRCTVLRDSSHQGLCLAKHSHFISARHVPCFDALYTKHLHSVLYCSGSSIFNPLRRSTTSSRWRFCGTTTSCRLWAQPDRRQPDCW